jgi:diguanylate cyclase (GGDEF)-like protein/PAS domain S-box-containing protein
VPETLRQEYEALLKFIHLAPVGLVQAAADGMILMMNPLAAQLLMPLSADGQLSHLFTALESVAPELRNMAASFSRERGFICDAMQIRVRAGAPGQEQPSVLSMTLIKVDAHCLMAVVSDVTVAVMRERQRRQSEAWLNAIVRGVSDYALMTLDELGRIEAWNPSVGRITGFAAAAVVGLPYSIFYPPGAITPDRLGDRLREADHDGWSLDDGWRVKADGARFWGSALITPLNDLTAEGADSADAASHQRRNTVPPTLMDPPEHRRYGLIIRDISERREASESLRKATLCDHLTEVANRRAFFETAELEIARWRKSPRPLSLILFDADFFKLVNDTYGHAGGDTVLRRMAAILVDTARAIDFVARIGGEEFAILLPSTGIDGAEDLANRIRVRIESEVLSFDGREICYTVSAGVSAMDATVTGLDVLMKRADQALYAAKRQGRNRVVRADQHGSDASLAAQGQ